MLAPPAALPRSLGCLPMLVPLRLLVQACDSLELLKVALSSSSSAEVAPDLVAEAACRECVLEALLAALPTLDFPVSPAPTHRVPIGM